MIAQPPLALALASLALGGCTLPEGGSERPARRDSIHAVESARYMEALIRRDSVRALRATFSDSALQPLGFQDLDSLMHRVREFGEEHSNMPPGSRRLEFERRFPGALTPFDAWSEWRRIEFGDDETPERLRLLMRGLSGDGSNSATTSSRSSRYQLFTECAPVKLSRFGVTAAFTGTAGVREMAESRLRAARIWGGREDDDGEADPLILHIDYGSTRATFRKEVWDPLSGEFYISEVWTRVLLGADLEAEESQRASTLTDRFILNYLRVNEEACQ